MTASSALRTSGWEKVENTRKGLLGGSLLPDLATQRILRISHEQVLDTLAGRHAADAGVDAVDVAAHEHVEGVGLVEGPHVLARLARQGGGALPLVEVLPQRVGHALHQGSSHGPRQQEPADLVLLVAAGQHLPGPQPGHGGLDLGVHVRPLGGLLGHGLLGAPVQQAQVGRHRNHARLALLAALLEYFAEVGRLHAQPQQTQRLEPRLLHRQAAADIALQNTRRSHEVVDDTLDPAATEPEVAHEVNDARYGLVLAANSQKEAEIVHAVEPKARRVLFVDAVVVPSKDNALNGQCEIGVMLHLD
mmetsp:Transcript_23994/g.32871  ORF Transcript_23994/g.32871 Transcript_23994/m.32871 type:complete len:305 (+) Transcript_23994:974-1888(+)